MTSCAYERPDLELLPENPSGIPALLLIADISGYTRFLVSNSKAEAHGQAIINRLMTVLVETISPPFEIAKLEGDGIFFFVRLDDTEPSRSLRENTSDLVLRLFARFNKESGNLQVATNCPCQACRNIHRLRLKIVGHQGTAIETEIAGFRELTGLDVTLVHRLQKNSLQLEEYILFTKAADRLFDLPSTMPSAPVEDDIEGIGKLELVAYQPEECGLSTLPESPPTVRDRFHLSVDLWFSQTQRHRHSQKRSLPLTIMTLLLTPIYLPVSIATAAIHSFRARLRLGNKTTS